MTEMLPLAHLMRLTDEWGLVEHARGDVPDRSHGYCVDDAARALSVVAREPHPAGELEPLLQTYLSFVESAIAADGRCRNRRAMDGTWTDEPTMDDCWGRAIQGLGFAATRSPSASVRERALIHAVIALKRRSPHVRASAFAAIGAAEILETYPSFGSVRRFLVDVLDVLPRQVGRDWDWPEERLRYANASLADAVIAVGSALDQPAILARGLEMLQWLVEVETRPGHLSVVGTAGAAPGDPRPLFDQQPIEVAAIADAAARAWEVTSDPRWLRALELAWGWFAGVNDGGIVMYEPESGAGFDGLEPQGRNDNRGAESTLAFLSTLQHSRRLLYREYA